MKVRCVCMIAIAISIAFPLAPAASAVVIATSKGAGADAEVRDHQPATNLGASTELATRILDNFPAGASDVNDRFSAMYMKFDITGQFDVPNQATSLRLTYRNSNLTPNRIHDPTPPGNNTDFRTGLAFYGLDRDHPGNNWSEATITYSNAPGIASDGNNGTKDYDFVDPDGGGPLRTVNAARRRRVPRGASAKPPSRRRRARLLEQRAQQFPGRFTGRQEDFRDDRGRNRS